VLKSKGYEDDLTEQSEIAVTTIQCPLLADHRAD